MATRTRPFGLVSLVLMCLASPSQAQVHYGIFTIPKRSLVITGKDARTSATKPTLAELLAVAERGNADAQFELSLRYRDGRGVKRDHAEALKWARKAADAGNAAALDAVGFQYQLGWGVTQNYDVAFGYYQSAAKAGNLTGMNNPRVRQVL